MNKRQLFVMWIGIALLCATWMFPPRLPMGPLMFSPLVTLSLPGVDWSHLILLDLIILALTVGVILSLRTTAGPPRKSFQAGPPRRMAKY